MFSEERRAEILKLLEQDERVIAKELAARFDLSIDSIRRDLSLMEEKGLLQRTHGGAIKIAKVRSPASPPTIRYGQGGPLENAISKLAVSFIQERDTVFISGAGIHYGMLKFLNKSMPITVITNSLKIADTLQAYEQIDVYIIGGKVKPGGNITDILAYEFVSQFSIDIGFLTGGGISANGITLGTPETASLIRAISQASRRTICLAPHYKLGVDAFAKAIPVEEIDLLITDEEAAKDKIERIEKKGVQVLIASSADKTD